MVAFGNSRASTFPGSTNTAVFIVNSLLKLFKIVSDLIDSIIVAQNLV
jgi:hypothetical protein